jgi:hypothetical protein
MLKKGEKSRGTNLKMTDCKGIKAVGVSPTYGTEL